MIRGVISSLEERVDLVHLITTRSIIEHLIDLAFIALKDDKKLNILFENYYLIVRYTSRKETEYFTDEIPRIEKEYREYILKYFIEIVKKYSNKSGLIAVPDWEKIDDYISNKYKISWSGKSFYDRNLSVIIESFLKYDIEDNNLNWNSIHEKVIKNHKDTWKTMSFKNRVNEILKAIRLELANDNKVDIDKIDPYFEQIDQILIDAPKYYGIFCNYIHPTAYSAIPHYEFKNRTFDLKYDNIDKTLYDIETFLYLVTDSSVNAFSMCLNDKERIELINKMNHLESRSPMITNWLFNRKNNATHSSHQ